MNMKRHFLSFSVFLIGGLVGPVVSLATTILSLDRLSIITGQFNIGRFVFFIWPSKIFGFYESVYGELKVAIVAVLVNIIMYSIIGLTLVALKKWSVLFVCFVVVIILFLNVLAFWSSGWSFHFLDLVELALACLFYSALSFFVWRIEHSRS